MAPKNDEKSNKPEMIEEMMMMTMRSKGGLRSSS
jgi:hypothetical protein